MFFWISWSMETVFPTQRGDGMSEGEFSVLKSSPGRNDFHGGVPCSSVSSIVLLSWTLLSHPVCFLLILTYSLTGLFIAQEPLPTPSNTGSLLLVMKRLSGFVWTLPCLIVRDRNPRQGIQEPLSHSKIFQRRKKQLRLRRAQTNPTVSDLHWTNKTNNSVTIV